ncbi:hypothetical protein SAY87_016499 [Trapa incisa]|uniref:GDSL esterase/lipase EXL3 n=1 Tax=Trapa incisa TaxID=236973 RepID=A0AAN7QZ48_9MYRT|nr:hypothetical protein SAY87_016499 [Trapa incisa]
MESPHLNRPSRPTASMFSASALILLISATATLDGALPTSAKVPAVFVFGDSMVDPGNNNDLDTMAKCNFPPYGRDFPGATPTGRFSNGKVPSDMLAEAFGVKELLPAYLDPELQIHDLLTGVSYASGAAGYDPQTAEDVKVLSLSDQLDLFNESVARIKAEVGEERAASIVSESFYAVCIGSNDIINTFFPLQLSNQEKGNISSYTDLMAEYASSFIQELYGLGGRRIALFGIGPIGCVPSQRTLRGGFQRDCFDQENEAAVIFNTKLYSLADSLSSQLPGSKIVYMDVFYSFFPLIQDPSQYGFEVATRGCCGTGNIEASYLCNNLDDILTCVDDEKYIFWDSFHPTEKAYRIAMDQILTDNMNKFF